MKIVDARGLSCPEPVIMLQDAMKSNESSYQLLTDCNAATENTTRFAKEHGWDIDIKKIDDYYTITFTK